MNFQDLYERRGLAPATARRYAVLIERVERHLRRAGTSLAACDAEQVRRAVEDARVPSSSSSRDQVRSALAHYWAESGRHDGPTWAIRPVRARARRCRALPEGAARRLAAHAAARDDRPGLAVTLGIYTGLRRAEIAQARWEAFEPEADQRFGWLNVIRKGSVEGTVPISAPLARVIERHDPPDSGWLFPGRFGGSVHPEMIWEWCRMVAADAGIGPVPTHVLRHTALATANDETGDLRAVQELAGHSKISTTQGYTRTTTRRLRAAGDSIGAALGGAA